MVEFTLMHKDVPVVDLSISEYSGGIEQLGVTHNPEHLPLRTTITSGRDKGMVLLFPLNDWWSGRSIPPMRDGIHYVLDRLNLYSPVLLLTKCYGLSLTDHYWICPRDSGIRWEAVNFFDYDFPLDMGDMLFNRNPEDLSFINLMSPDNTTDGRLRKKWIIADGKQCLIKGGSGVYQQEPFNEAITSAVARRLKIPHVDYTLTFEENKPYSLCENFVTPETELIPAWLIRDSYDKHSQDSRYLRFLESTESHGIPGARASLEKMLLLDYIVANENRHYNNFGFIRNAITLEWLGMAPIYDSGESMWYNTSAVGCAVESKPFQRSHEEQLGLIKDFSWVDYEALYGLTDEIMVLLSSSDIIEITRAVAIAQAVGERCERIKEVFK